MHLKKLSINGEVYSTNFTKPWKKNGVVPGSVVEQVFSFAYGMTFGGGGRHRNHRSGGIERRKLGQIFADAFQGKLGEFCVYDFFQSGSIQIDLPNLELWDLGKWDSSDFELEGRNFNIKSSKFYSNLLLLETKDWSDAGVYLPNGKTYDYFIFVRIKPDIVSLLKSTRFLYSDSIDRDALYQLVVGQVWEYDIPGFVTNLTLLNAISSRMILPQGACLNSATTRMDAENYYLQSGDFEDIHSLIDVIKGWH